MKLNRRSRLMFLAVFVMVLTLVYSAWRKQIAFPGEVAQRVTAGIPIGTPRGVAETWIVQNFNFAPTYQVSEAQARALGTSIFQRAGVPEPVPGGVIFCTAKPNDLIGSALDKLRPNHVWAFLLLDNKGQVQDYRFLSFAELAKMEQAEAAGG